MAQGQQDVSGFGTSMVLIASNTYPLVGVPITNFAADTDPFDVETIEIAGHQMGLNGDMIVWAQAKGIPYKVALIPGSAADIALQLLFDNNRVGPNKQSSADIITLNLVMPDGTPISYGGGRCLTYPPGRSTSASGQQKTRVYGFVFASKVGG